MCRKCANPKHTITGLKRAMLMCFDLERHSAYIGDVLAAGPVSYVESACLVHVSQVNTARLVHVPQEIVLQSGQGEVQVAQLEGAVKQITKFAQGSRFKQLARCLARCFVSESACLVDRLLDPANSHCAVLLPWIHCESQPCL